MHLLKKIQENLQSYSNQQKKVAVYILENYKLAAFLTTTELSLKSHVSSATINRFCISLDFKGYSDFQEALQEVIQSELTSVERVKQTSLSTNTIDSVFLSEADQLEKVAKNISRSDYQKILKLLNKARRIVILGHQASEPVALYAAYSFGKIRNSVEYLSLSSLDILGRLQNLGPEDTAMVIGMPRYPKQTVDLMKILSGKKVRIALITHSEFSPLIKDADAALTLPISYHRFTDGLSPLICLINAFALELYNENKNEADKCLGFFESLSQVVFKDPK